MTATADPPGDGGGGDGADGGGPGAADGGDLPSSDSHRYFQELEALYFDLVDTASLLSAHDYQIAKGWHERGIPLEHVRARMEEALRKRRERGDDDPLGLRYYRRAVERSWKAVEEMRATGERGEAAGLDVAARLAALAEALPADLAGRGELAERITALEGDTEHVESALAALDHELLESAEEGLSGEERDAVEQGVEDTVSSLFGRLFAGDVEKARDRLRRQALRRQLGLPVLSLFSPEAERGEDG